jgi:hypothetical protein
MMTRRRKRWERPLSEGPREEPMAESGVCWDDIADIKSAMKGLWTLGLSVGKWPRREGGYHGCDVILIMEEIS